MSVHRTPTGSWRVRWREHDGRMRSKTFRLRRDADRVDRELHRRRELLPFSLAVADAMTVADLYADWLANYARPNLAANTCRSYASAWRNHLEPRVGRLDLRELTPSVCADLAAGLITAELTLSSRAKTLALLSSMLRRGVVLGRIAHHPMRGAVHVPQSKRARVIDPPTPAQIWQLAGRLEGAGRMLVLLIGFAGLRPGEALALDWRDVGKRALNVERTLTGRGETKMTKTGRARSVDLVPALETELVAYRLETGGDARGFVFRRLGHRWSSSAYDAWRTRSFTPAARASGMPGLRPYDLRHAYASLLLHEGRSVLDVAAQLGHSPSMCLDTYGHVMRGLSRRTKAATAIARAKHVPSACPPGILDEGAR